MVMYIILMNLLKDQMVVCYRALSTGTHPSPVTGAGASTYWDYVTCASWACPVTRHWDDNGVFWGYLPMASSTGLYDVHWNN